MGCWVLLEWEGLPYFFFAKKPGIEITFFLEEVKGGCSEPRPKLLIFLLEASFIINPNVTISIIVRETPAPVTEVGEMFVLEEDLMCLPILQSYASTSTKRLRDINLHFDP